MTRRAMLIASLGVIFLGLALGACSSKHADCNEAVSHMYDMGCAILIDGQELSRSEALNGCIEGLPNIKNCGCFGQYQDLLDCLAGIGQGQCSACTAEFTAFNTCFGNCG
jgi:hypothetical protein